MLALVASACARAVVLPKGSAGDSVLPPVPLVDGALAPRVQYPPPGHLIASRDSNFIFGSVGSGRATLTINGVPVRVLPNGSFLAFLANPPGERPVYSIVAVLDGDTLQLEHPVRIQPPRPALALDGPLVVDSASLSPRGGALALREDELVRVSVRAPENSSVWVRWDSVGLRPAGERALLSAAAHRADSAGTAAHALVSHAAARYLGDREQWATDLPAALLRAGATLVVARGTDTVRLPVAAVAAPDSAPMPAWAILGADSQAISDTDRVVIARPLPGDTYRWFLLPGTRLEVTGRDAGFARVRLDHELEVWVPAEELTSLPHAMARPRRVTQNVRVVAAAEWTDVVLPISERAPYLIEQRGEEVHLTLYGTQANTDVVYFRANDSLVRVITWEQETNDRVRYILRLGAAPFGFLVFWDRGSVVVRLRRPPRVDSRAPLRGLTIAVDAGHPPAGSTGPTGLYEGVATLAVAERVRALLEARGARVLMTRSNAEPVALRDRPIMARRANAHALVSIHLNALGDGQNPFVAHGTETYYFHPQAEPMARAIQRGMVRRLGLRDLGTHARSLALARASWMPAVLCEGAFIMLPEHEAALRTPEFRERYALGVVEGLEAYFLSLTPRG